jgi:hypothetical protein
VENLVAMALLSAMSCIISPRRLLSMASRNFSRLVLQIFMGSEARSRAHSTYKDQVVSRLDEGLVLLQGALAFVPMGRENRSRPPLTHERFELSYKALYPRLC